MGTSPGEFLGYPTTSRSFRVHAIAVLNFEGDRIVNERVYLDTPSLLRQIGRLEILKHGTRDLDRVRRDRVGNRAVAIMTERKRARARRGRVAP